MHPPKVEPMTPRQRYETDISEGRIRVDPAQERVVVVAERIYQELVGPLPQSLSIWDRLRGKQPPPVRGMYLWGGVGRGKTYLVDSFFHCLPFAEKRRVHFQRFMQDIHNALRDLPKTPDPLPIVARNVARTTRALCLDEFHVDDVADAMLLSGLLRALFDLGVTLLFTSNIPPDLLYENGLQRERFLPVIDWIKTHADVVELTGAVDYRVMSGDQRARAFYVPNDERAQAALKQQFALLAGDVTATAGALMLNSRAMPVVGLSRQVIWFEFDALCNTPRSAADYLVIASQYRYVLVSGLRAMDSNADDIANRFIQFVDALYDNRNVLFATSAVEIAAIYQGRALSFQFARTASRLREMFSEDYVSALSHARSSAR